VARCGWCGDDPLYVRYHDTEWGHPLTDPVRLFEKMCLEGFQSGLAWITILRKRESFRAAFEGFVPQVVAGYGEADVQRLLADAGIVRHRGKIESTINNARRVLELDVGLDELVERYRPVAHQRPTSTLPASTTESTALARDLKRRGFSFVGPTTMYAFMQSVGLVNDHLVGCERT
jgi:DNA-3-methyladenine glycosylase I